MPAARVLPLVLLLAASASLSAQVPLHPIPRPHELVDTGAFAAFARQRVGEARGDAVLSLVFDSAGRLVSTRAIEGTLPPELKSVLADSVLTYLKPQAPWVRGRWWARLAVRVGPELTLRTEGCHVQGPTPVSSSDIGPILAAGGNPPTGRVELRFLVSETGRVLRAEAGPGTAALSPLQVAPLIERLRYAPGNVDGQAQPMWVAMRVQLAGSVRMR